MILAIVEFILAWCAIGFVAGLIGHFVVDGRKDLTVGDVGDMFGFSYVGPILFLLIAMMLFEKYGKITLWRKRK